MGLIHLELFATLDPSGRRPAVRTRTPWVSRSAAGRLR